MQHLSFEIPSQQGLLDAVGNSLLNGTNVIISLSHPCWNWQGSTWSVTLVVGNGLEMGAFNPFEGFWAFFCWFWRCLKNPRGKISTPYDYTTTWMGEVCRKRTPSITQPWTRSRSHCSCVHLGKRENHRKCHKPGSITRGMAGGLQMKE